MYTHSLDSHVNWPGRVAGSRPYKKQPNRWLKCTMHLTKTDELEAQGLVVHNLNRISFCKNWSLIFLDHFSTLKEQGFTLSVDPQW